MTFLKYLIGPHQLQSKTIWKSLKVQGISKYPQIKLIYFEKMLDLSY